MNFACTPRSISDPVFLNCGILFEQLFVNDNQGGEETTVINTLCFIGTLVETTNMSEFKRVRGILMIIIIMIIIIITIMLVSSDLPGGK